MPKLPKFPRVFPAACIRTSAMTACSRKGILSIRLSGLCCANSPARGSELGAGEMSAHALAQNDNGCGAGSLPDSNPNSPRFLTSVAVELLESATPDQTRDQTFVRRRLKEEPQDTPPIDLEKSEVQLED